MAERAQSMNWFGEPWPSVDLRAEVCADDEYRSDVPVGIPCWLCGIAFVEADQGVLIPTLYSSVDWSASHLQCFLDMILGKKGHRR